MTFQIHHRYHDFARSVRLSFRYARSAEQNEFLTALAATCDARAVTMKAGLCFWRAQLGHDWQDVEQDGHTFEVAAPFPVARMKPDPAKVSDGRANPRGIACLYLATQRETAVLEVRPISGLFVSVAQFEVVRDLRLVDCTKREIGNLAFLDKNLSQKDREKVVWSDINEAFSEPVARGDDGLEYVPTQIIAEVFKVKGYDGMAYKSRYGDDGYNIVLFDIDGAKLIDCELYNVKNISIELSAQGSRYFVR